MIIYKITNKINGKIYIGQTRNSLTKRWYEHRFTNKTSPIHLAILKYGSENFSIEQIDVANSKEELTKLEQHWMDLYKSKTPNGYNILDAGNAPEMNEEVKKLLKEKCGKVWLGKRHSENTKKKMSEAALGKPKSELAKSNMRKPKSEEHKNAMKKPKSEEGRLNIRASAHKRSRRIVDQFGTVYNSIREASRLLNINQSCIYDVLSGRAKATKAYIFRDVI